MLAKNIVQPFTLLLGNYEGRNAGKFPPIVFGYNSAKISNGVLPMPSIAGGAASVTTTTPSDVSGDWVEERNGEKISALYPAAHRAPFCRNCGAWTLANPSSNFCWRCGAPRSADASNTAAATPSDGGQVSGTFPSPGSWRWKLSHHQAEGLALPAREAKVRLLREGPLEVQSSARCPQAPPKPTDNESPHS